MNKKTIFILITGFVFIICTGCLSKNLPKNKHLQRNTETKESFEKSTVETDIIKSQSNNMSNASANENNTENLVEKYGAGDEEILKYYDENGIIISVINVKNSEDIQTEKEAYEDLISRGFDQTPIYCEYDIEGNYINETPITADSEEKHPTYYTQYTSPSGDYWTISLTNGNILANPVSFNLLGDYAPVQTVYGESDSIIGFDSGSNCFYKVLPDEDVLLVNPVYIIDAKTLNKL